MPQMLAPAAKSSEWKAIAAIDENPAGAGEVVDGREPLLLIVGVAEGPAKSARAADIRCQHGDPVVDQMGEDLAVVGPRLAFGRAGKVNHGARGTSGRSIWPCVQLQPVTRRDRLRAGGGREPGDDRTPA